MASVKKKLWENNGNVTLSSNDGICASSLNFEKGQRTIHLRKGNGFKGKAQTHHQSLNDSLDGELRAFLIDEDALHTYDDLTKVNPVTPTTVLRCLQARYRAKVFYTQAGCTLVALNPFQPIPHLYTLDVMREYHCAPQPQEFKPHIFIAAEEAYRNVQGQVEPNDQSLVVSGESGAGKTWTSRCLMKYYATVAASSSSPKCQDTVERIEKRVLDSNPLMEAFGNACTLRNNNSSRFGKYIQLQLNRSQILVGASIQTYLLEKTRVAFQAANERNFHIFYQMMKGATEEQRHKWRMSRDQGFTWLPNADKTLEEDCFQETTDAMTHMGITKAKQGQIFQILAGLLHLGNVSFSPPMDESQPCDLQEQSKDFLQNTAELLQIPQEQLLACLRLRALTAGKQSVVFKPCSLAECTVRRDCLAKVIYAHVFDSLVAFINGSVCADPSSWCNFIGVLDVYGFECFALNNLEQLCINYANEKLQQHFVAHYLKAQQEEYVSEGLEWSFIKYQDNQGCLDLIEGSPTCIFSLLNEECRLKRASDAKQFKARLEKELSNNACISWDRFSKRPHFTVSHYAGKVCYQITGMMEKNKDPVPLELIHMLQKSQDPLLQSLFVDHDIEVNNSRGHVVSKFKNSLESLMKILHSTTPHYTRCIKPNPECQPLTFKKEEVIVQLQACGIVETINISAAGFPIRIPYPSFLQRYGLIVNSRMWRPSINGNGPEMDESILSPMVADVLNVVLQSRSPDPPKVSETESCSSLVHCGKTKVFLTHHMLELLESQRHRMRSRRAFFIQHSWRTHRRRKQEAQSRAAIRIQAAVRAWLIRRVVLQWHKAATLIQKTWRQWRAAMEVLAETELDDVVDVTQAPVYDPTVWESGAVQLSTGQDPVTVWAWPLGLALASAPSITVAMTASSFQKVVSLMACLKLSFRSGDYKVETNQFEQGVASIRAQPQVFRLFAVPLQTLVRTPSTMSGEHQVLLITWLIPPLKNDGGSIALSWCFSAAGVH
ncbi:unconventional myosin-XIX isoform X2 [Conger conger]|uniref:unconventional myosin-XIX isoform X2 n=1 Tax=Conger conger TaxID=82655 RepID=UPI002A5A01CD|nr:unconventional myosin-XIX isoform X2 [Conger conger]